MSKKIKLTEEEQRLLLGLVKDYEQEDISVRQRQIMVWRRLKLMWEGIHRVYYSEVAHDWRIYDYDDQNQDSDQSSYDKPMNVYRAYLESIFAALSVTIPPVKCYPDDADNNLDLTTAKAGDKAASLIYRYNNIQLKWLHGLFVYGTEGAVFCKHGVDKNERYGTYEVDNYEDVDENHLISKCPSCGFTIEDEVVPTDYSPEGVLDVEVCPGCGQEVTPEVETDVVSSMQLVGKTKEAKSRIQMDMYGGLNVKVPNWARNQADLPYLIYCYETHYTNAIERFVDLDNEMLRSKLKDSSGPKDPYEEWARLSPQYNGEYPKNVVTVKETWLRPSAFNALDEEQCKHFKKKFPKGVRISQVNDLYAECCAEELDKNWTVTYNPLSDNIHFDPIGLLLVSTQELTNDLTSLITQTIEHGISQTFADPGVLNFNAYRQMESVPGGIYEATPKSGKSVADAFYEVKTATLSQEVMPFFQNIQSLGQLVSGANPTLFGGALEGSETASQFSMSRAQALQRLQNTWKMLTLWWKDIFGKVIPMYMEEIKEDERDVQRTSDGGFFNVFIRKSEMEGKIGKIELEANENLPITWSQQRDIIMQLLQSANPEILAVIGAPENLPYLRQAIGLEGIFVPGEDDKDKQNDEIRELLQSEPLIEPGMTDEMGMPGQEIELPSVEIDPDYDNHQIQFEICRKWIISEEGRQTKIDNPQGFRNVLLHGKMHLMIMQQQMMAAAAEQEQENKGNTPGKKSKETDKEAPIQENEDVATV